MNVRTASRIFTNAGLKPRLHTCALRPTRSLTARQRRALDLLRDAGADLHDDYLASELKSAFRRLAQRLHPDMHPRASIDERAELSARFRGVREAYGVLQA